MGVTRISIMLTRKVLSASCTVAVPAAAYPVAAGQVGRRRENVMTDDLGDRRPMHQRISDQIAADVAQSKCRPGEPTPTEAELVAKHKLSIGTVKKPLDSREGRGLIGRAQGSGSCAPVLNRERTTGSPPRAIRETL